MRISKRYEKITKVLFLIRLFYLSLVAIFTALVFFIPNMAIYSILTIFVCYPFWFYFDITLEYQKKVEIKKLFPYTYRAEKKQ